MVECFRHQYTSILSSASSSSSLLSSTLSGGERSSVPLRVCVCFLTHAYSNMHACMYAYRHPRVCLIIAVVPLQSPSISQRPSFPPGAPAVLWHWRPPPPRWAGSAQALRPCICPNIGALIIRIGLLHRGPLKGSIVDL